MGQKRTLLGNIHPHNLKVVGSNPTPATNKNKGLAGINR